MKETTESRASHEITLKIEVINKSVTHDALGADGSRDKLSSVLQTDVESDIHTKTADYG